MKKYIIYISAILFVAVSASSCKAWLNVDSEDRILEEKLFQDKDGFYTALNGVYVDLVNTNLYSGKFGPSTPDILAQYYDTSTDSHIYGSLAQFQQEAKRLEVSEMWNRAYFLILNINKIIWHCDDKKGSVLDEKDYNIIKGECLGLRAMFHFELLRYFGPIFQSAPAADAIPYIKSDEPKVNPVLKAKEVATLIIEDFNSAMSLLEKSDPVIQSGKNDVDNGGRNLYNFRNIRLNYFAVKALTSRACMYIGKTREKDYREDALKLAEEVIRDAAKFFPFSTREEVTGQAAVGSANTSAEDRVLSSDVLFSVYNVKRGADVYERLFSNTLEAKQLLSVTTKGFDQLYPDKGDLRTYQWQRKTDASGKTIMCFVKYEAMEVAGKHYPYMLPVVRMSEMYLIAAECLAEGPSSDKARALTMLNEVKKARQTSSANDGSNLMKEIETEYRKEFIGEGQLFWFYKRNWRTSIPVLYDENKGNAQLNESNYQFELPQSEDGYRS